MKKKLNLILTLFLAFVVQLTFAQEKIVSGTVIDAEGVPLPGVNVIVQGTNNGTQTDFDGNYNISTAQGQILVFSYVGFTKQSQTVGAAKIINVTLDVDAAALDEVVVVAYGTQKKGAIVGSVSSVSAEKIEEVPIASFDQILKGQVPGLHVISGSGQPGAAAKVRIRGTHSINGGSSPLYILDGVPITEGDFATLNSNDFESISVLKDAASTSIYGSRGSSGVIVITTKGGSYNTASSIRYTAQYGESEIGQKRFELMDAREKRIFDNIQNPGTWTEAEIANSETTDWTDYFFRRGITQTHNLAMSGGGENTKFYSSISYYDQEGIGLRSNLQRFNYRLNLDHKVSKKVSVGGNMAMGYSKSNFSPSEGAINLNNPFAAAYLGSPYDRPYREDGYFNVGPGLVGGNALENLNRNVSREADLKLLANFYGQAEVVDNVIARIDLGLDYINRDIESAIGPETYLGQNGGIRGNKGNYSNTQQYEANINTVASLKYNNTFNEKHNLSVGVFTEYYKYHFKTSGFTGFGINPKLVGYAAGITAGDADNGFIPTTRGGVAERGLFSYFGNAKYSYDEKYYLDATIRRDASSRFSDANKWGTFWAIGASWNISKEAFLENTDWLQELKLRASYGTTGNQSGIGSFQDEGLYTTTTYNGTPGIIASSVGNDQLKWEESAKLDIGLDFGFFRNRLTGSVDYYEENISDLFINQSLSASSGFGSIDANAGKMRNRGFDGNLKVDVIRTPDFGFSVNGNFNYNKNEIVDLGQESEYELGTSIIREGLPFGSHYIVGWAGVNPSNGAPLYYDKEGNVTNVYSADNSTANWGSYEPVWTGGYGATLRYKGFSASALFTFAKDYYRFNNQSFFQENPNFAQYNLSSELLTVWQKPGDVTNIQGLAYNREFSSKDIEDASYMRLTNLTLSYNLPESFTGSNGLFKDVRIFVLGQNLYTWTKFTGFDPEDDNNIASYEYPTPRTITLGVDLTF